MKSAVLALLIPALLLAGVARGQEASQQQAQGQAPPVVDQEPPEAAEAFDPVASQLPPGTPDQVVTFDGNAITGDVKEMTGARLKVRTISADYVYIKWEFVRTVRTSTYFEVEVRGGDRYYGLLVGTDDGRLFVGSAARFVEVARTDVVGITRIRLGFWERLKGNLTLGVGLSKTGNQREVTGNGKVWYRTRVSRFEFKGDAYVRRQDGAEDVNRNAASFTFTRYLPNKWLATAVVSAAHNEELGLDLRAYAGAGGGYHLVRSIRHDLLAWGGLVAATERFLGEEETQRSLESVVAVRYTYYLLSFTNTTADFAAAMFPSLTESGRLRTEVDVSLRHEFTRDLYFSIDGFFSSDNRAHTEESSNDYGLSLGAGFTW